MKYRFEGFYRKDGTFSIRFSDKRCDILYSPFIQFSLKGPFWYPHAKRLEFNEASWIAGWLFFYFGVIVSTVDKKVVVHPITLKSTLLAIGKFCAYILPYVITLLMLSVPYLSLSAVKAITVKQALVCTISSSLFIFVAIQIKMFLLTVKVGRLTAMNEILKSDYLDILDDILKCQNNETGRCVISVSGEAVRNLRESVKTLS